jgi:CRISPR-associated protein Cas2
MRRFYLVSYDIPDDRRRSRIFKLMRGWGERGQYSVFCCQLNPRERLELIDELKTRMNADEDQTLFVEAGAVEGERPVPDIAYVGKVWRPEQRSQVV